MAESQYKRYEEKEHILKCPDTYVGSKERTIEKKYIYDNESNRIILKEIESIDALIKLCDECFVNARDHYVRLLGMAAATIESSTKEDKTKSTKIWPLTKIDITIENKRQITILNDGNGIDIIKHPEYGIWIPELICAHMRTSTNYTEGEKRIVGGKNGFGIKLVFVWSTYGYIETIDSERGLKYFQEFKNNLSEVCIPIITNIKKGTKPYTKISFIPDYDRLDIPEGLTDDIIALLKKRASDISAFVGSAKVYFGQINVAAADAAELPIAEIKTLLNVKNFQQLVDLYIGKETRVYEAPNERWEYAVCLSSGISSGGNSISQVSYVNAICTNKGGKHVEYIINQLIKKIITIIETKKKVKISPNIIKEQLCIFLRCDIENPSFDSQIKDYLTTPINKFGSTCIVSDAFAEKIAKMIIKVVCSIAEIKENNSLDKAAKKTDGVKSGKIYGIVKLDDANWAGTAKSDKCTLILCEGDSAKAGVISGLTSEMRNFIGVFPLKGKLLNVRGESMEKILLNEEIINIKKILGLANKAVYTAADIKKLRYSKVLILTDADVDGSHIKGLCINLFDVLWPSLLYIDGFIGYMNTPILKARKGTEELLFYNEGEYKIWKELQSATTIHKWKIKYYKGLGTSTGKEFREYFQNNKIVNFTHTEDTGDCIDMIFNKKRANDRKTLLENYTGETVSDTSLTIMDYKYFIYNELVIFSKYDCERSIPNIMDGLKTSNRKILYVVMKKNITTEMKVAQLGALIAQESSYHHGEISLIKAIIGMAQDFVGANNINLLMPNGQFGTRRQGGEDHASERYIFTEMNKITRHIYIDYDDHILKYLNDDGVLVEPMFYAPIIPMVLINGSKGIGTGFSTEILCYDAREIIKYLSFKLTTTASVANASVANASNATAYNEYDKLLLPYYKGFKGEIIPLKDKFLIKGIYTKLDENTIHITELPIGMWTENFRKLLDELMGEGTTATKKTSAESATGAKKDSTKKQPTLIIKDYTDMSNDAAIDFTIVLHTGVLADLESKIDKVKGVNLVYTTFNLATTLTTSNMHLFDAVGRLRKYSSIIEIIDEYYITRLELYQVRKNYLIDKLTNELIIIENKVKYIREVLASTIDLRRMSQDAVYKLLSDKEYMLIDNNYYYLTRLAMDSVTDEKIADLENKYESKRIELEEVSKISIENMWLRELDILSQELGKLVQEVSNTPLTVKKTKKGKSTK
jgi:DNA topoisomerase-2